MIRLERVSTECFDEVSLYVGSGIVCKIIAASAYEKGMLLDTMVGISRPLGGRVLLLGKDIYSSPEGEIMKVLEETGVVREDGGLISNLKVWENILLPVWYHKGKGPGDMEGEVAGLLHELGVGASMLAGYLERSPAVVPDREKRIIGLIRSVLMEPRLMIYDSIFDGLDPKTTEALLRFTEDFHSRAGGRTSIYLASDDAFLKKVSADMVIRQEGRVFRRWD